MPSSISSSEGHDIRRFAGKVLLFLAIQGVIAAAILVPFMYFAPDTYMAELNDKQHRLETLPGPRLVLVGSSNLAFSWDSALAKHQLGLEAVNMGLHQGLGLQFVLNQTQPYVRSGDVVILAPEYSHFVGDMSTDTLPESLLTSPQATLAGLDYHVFQRLADETLAMLGRRTRTLALMAIGAAPLRPEAPYRHDSFNELGEVVSHRNLDTVPTRPLGRRIKFDPWRVDDVIDRLNEFIDSCQQRGATVFYSCPPYPQTEYNRDRADLDKLHHELVAKLHAPVISAPADTVYPDDWFYDTEYHLRDRGLTERTQLVLSRLTQFPDALAAQSRQQHLREFSGVQQEPTVTK